MLKLRLTVYLILFFGRSRGKARYQRGHSAHLWLQVTRTQCAGLVLSMNITGLIVTGPLRKPMTIISNTLLDLRLLLV